MSNLEALLWEQHWMIHDLVDGDQITNDEEEKLYDLAKNAYEELNKIKAWLLKAYTLMENGNAMESNSLAHIELVEIVKTLK